MGREDRTFRSPKSVSQVAQCGGTNSVVRLTVMSMEDLFKNYCNWN